MDEYVKLQLSLKERMVFLFTGHLDKKHMISKTNDTISINFCGKRLFIVCQQLRK